MHAAPSHTSITIRNLDAGLKQRLRLRAASHGHSMEAEARAILAQSLAQDPAPEPLNLAEAIHRRMAPLGGVELDLPPREPAREPPSLG